MTLPTFDIDPAAFAADPCPTYAAMPPIAYVPQLDAVLLTRREDVVTCERNVAVFSSVQPAGLVDQVMGPNMMRRDGDDHQAQRRMAFPSLSGRTIAGRWRALFEAEARGVIEGLRGRETCDLVTDYAMPVSGHALRHITGLTQFSAAEMDWASQALIDAIANYGGDAEVAARGAEAGARISAAIKERQGDLSDDDVSLVAVLTRAGMDQASIVGNIRLVISGGQNEPRDAIAGTAFALLSDPSQNAAGRWADAFNEYCRWVAPIGMSPRRVTQDHSYGGVTIPEGARAFLMFGAANRDPEVFENAELFDIDRDTSKAVAFGAGPHFCAGAGVSRTLVADIALPMLFEAFPKLAFDGDVPFHGWAFRGATRMPVRLHG
ncbi:MAG: cytochrome P450 [Shimia sp.]